MEHVYRMQDGAWCSFQEKTIFASSFTTRGVIFPIYTKVAIYIFLALYSYLLYSSQLNKKSVVSKTCHIDRNQESIPKVFP